MHNRMPFESSSLSNTPFCVHVIPFWCTLLAPQPCRQLKASCVSRLEIETRFAYVSRDLHLEPRGITLYSTYPLEELYTTHPFWNISHLHFRCSHASDSRLVPLSTGFEYFLRILVFVLWSTFRMTSAYSHACGCPLWAIRFMVGAPAKQGSNDTNTTTMFTARWFYRLKPFQVHICHTHEKLTRELTSRRW